MDFSVQNYNFFVFFKAYSCKKSAVCLAESKENRTFAALNRATVPARGLASTEDTYIIYNK